MVLSLCILSIILIIILSWIQLILDSKKSNIPGPFPIPLLGNGHLFLGDSAYFLKQLSKLAKKYNHAFQMYMLNYRFVVLSHPKYVEAVICSSKVITKDFAGRVIGDWLGEGLVSATGSRWQAHRKFLTPAFHFDVLQSYLPVFFKNEKILMKKLSEVADGSTLDFLPIITLTALDNITEAAMGKSVNAQENSESSYVKAVDEINEIVSLKMRNPFMASKTIFKYLPHKKRQDRILEVLRSHTEKVIEDRRRELEKLDKPNLNHDSEYGFKSKYAFLDLLLLGEVNGKKLDMKAITEEVDTFMFAGHDTTASGISFSIYFISQHQHVQEKIWAEQKSIFGDNMLRDPVYSEIQQMKYLELVIKESLRIYSPVPVMERLITKDMNIAGLHILRNTTVLVNVFEMQRNADIFEDPLEFRPERYETTKYNTYDWMAFGAGPRNCIGQKFAMLEMKIVLSALVRRFQLLPAETHPDILADVIIKSKNGICAKLLPRL